MKPGRPLYLPQAGPHLLETPLLNKGSAFSPEERFAFNLVGLLPPVHETIDEQVERSYRQYATFAEPIQKHIFLRALQDTNETLFHRLLQAHLVEMLPIVYTPTVGDACEHFSDIYRRARGLFISYDDRERLNDVVRSATKRGVKILVVTDGERVLGLGDQGIGGMGISIGKLSLYTAAGGISPAYTLPVCLDVGTDNPKLQGDPFYMGLRHPRIRGQAYFDFVDRFLEAALERWPDALVQFEDFAQVNAMPLLEKYRHRLCCFNDDIQGTAAVSVGALLAACRARGQGLRDQRMVFVGAGSAGCGIAEAVIRRMVDEGLSDGAARERIFMVDRSGLLTTGQKDLRDFQTPLAKDPGSLKGWNPSGTQPGLLETVRAVKPQALIGVSGVPGLFTEEVIREMALGEKNPIIFPLSNPSRQIEGHPHDILRWTGGRATVATGSPFPDLQLGGVNHPVAQCNNSYIFPGIGLGVLSCGARRVSDGMLSAASRALADASPRVADPAGALLPSLTELQNLSRKIAFAVADSAMAEGHALPQSEERLAERIERNFWVPEYRPYRRVAM